MLVFLTSGCNQHVSGRAKLAVLHPDRCLLAVTYSLTCLLDHLFAYLPAAAACMAVDRAYCLADISFERLDQRVRLVPVSWKKMGWV